MWYQIDAPYRARARAFALLLTSMSAAACEQDPAGRALAPGHSPPEAGSVSAIGGRRVTTTGRLGPLHMVGGNMSIGPCGDASLVAPSPDANGGKLVPGGGSQRAKQAQRAGATGGKRAKAELRTRGMRPMADPLANWDPGDECVSYAVVETDNQSAEVTSTPLQGWERTWSGESFSLDQGPEPGSPDRCAPWTTLPFDLIIHVPETGDEAKFQVPEALQKISDRGYTIFGQPMADYRLPENIYHSRDGKYSIYGGTISVICYTFLRRVSQLIFQAGLEVGRVFDYVGIGGTRSGAVRINRNPLNPGGGISSSGWAWTSPTLTNGFGEGWQQAVERWVLWGVCTPGYELWEGGEQKCKANGEEM